MLNRNLLSCALAALLAVPLALSGCGGVTEEESNGPKNCSSDTDCDTTEICHPVGSVCVKSCADASECDTGVCEAVVAGDTRLICKCTASSCGAVTVDGGTNNQVCSVGIDDVCENACEQDSDCVDFFPSRTCDTVSKLCVPIEAGCTSNASCTAAAASKCETSSGNCVACTVDSDCSHLGGLTDCDAGTCVSPGATCSEANKQPNTTSKGPDTCAYGEVCSASVCSAAALPDMTCNTAKAAPAWDETKFGPVITRAEGTSLASTPFCGGKGGYTIAIEFYAPNGVKGGTWTEKVKQVKVINVGATTADDTGISEGFPSAGATFGSFTSGGCSSGGGAIDPTGRAVYMIDSKGFSGNAVCL